MILNRIFTLFTRITVLIEFYLSAASFELKNERQGPTPTNENSTQQSYTDRTVSSLKIPYTHS